MSAPTDQPRSASGSEPTGRAVNWWWAAAAIAAIVAVGAGVWMFASGDDDQPTLSFDGETATYDGPATLDAGEISFMLRNDSDVDIGFVWGRHREEGHTVEEASAFAEANPGVPPPWVAEAVDIGEVLPPGASAEVTVTLQAAPHDLIAFEPATRATHVATIIPVIGDEE